MEGIRYVTDENNQKVAIQLDLDKYGALIEDLLDVLDAEAAQDDDTVTLEELKKELKEQNKL